MLAVDTNVVVRFLAGDDPDQETTARAIFDQHQILVDTVLLETEWVLRAILRIDGIQMNEAFTALVGLPQVHVSDRVRITHALRLMSAGVDFADALHVSGATDCQAFVTFDKALVKRSIGKSRIPVHLASDA